MYKASAFVHTYIGEGMEEGEFETAREIVEKLLDTYAELSNETTVEGNAG